MSGRKLAKDVRAGVTVSLPPDLVRQLNAYCLQFHISRSQAAEVAIRRFLIGERDRDDTKRAAE